MLYYMLKIIILLAIIIFVFNYFKSIEKFVGYGGNSNPPGYEHRWYNWEAPWGFPWMKCNPLKDYKEPIINWYWY